jgi:hypothetical protein
MEKIGIYGNTIEIIGITEMYSFNYRLLQLVKFWLKKKSLLVSGELDNG